MVSKRKLIGNVYDVAAYPMMHDFLKILGWKMLCPDVIKKISLIYDKTKKNISGHIEMIGERTDPAFYTEVIV